MKKYIFVTGGVCSSLGKGIAAASMGCLLESRGLRVRMVKADPYLNVDAGTMSPFQHGEVYVTDDGAETDLDLGNYARFTSSPLSSANSLTTGQIYSEVIKKEREGKYLGKCVQVIPHITDEIKRRIFQISQNPDVDITITEIGGTVGDIESIPFLEAVRQIIHEIGKQNAISVHLTLIPTVTSGESKTKPTQHSVKAMREIGIQPDMLLCRMKEPLPDDLRRKISMFTNIDYSSVFSAHDVSSTIYEIPLMYHEQKVDEIIMQKLKLKAANADLTHWDKALTNFRKASANVCIAMVGKYIDLEDSYKSVDEALTHGGIANSAHVEIRKIDAELIEENPDFEKHMAGCSGLLVPGGFGERGSEGMIQAITWARERKMPFFGICLGMQMMVVEYARSIMGLAEAYSTEFKPKCLNPVISLLEEQIDITSLGGTMRLGLSQTNLIRGTKLYESYGKKEIWERHRHRYEVNNHYRNAMIENGLVVAGYTPDNALVECVQWPDHPWGVGVQFHPEFSSKPVQSNPLFRNFIQAALKFKG
ncbi:MAG: CTP synthase [Spirochaetales bacterium]|nr:CTP synthase [Spirochaetales bacterium]